MMKNMKAIGGMLMAAALLMGLFSPKSFKEAAGKVTVTEDLIQGKNSCRLFVDGKEHELKPGTYANAMLLVEERYARAAQQTKLGKISASEDQYYSLYIDA